MTFKPLAIIEFFKNGRKVAEDDPTRYTEAELKILLEIQAMQGRTWSYRINNGNEPERRERNEKRL